MSSEKNSNDKSIQPTKPKWYIIQTYVGFEDAVKKALDQKITNLSLSAKILEIFIPTKKVLVLNKKGERQEKTQKIYPGYIYIHCVLDKEVGYLIQNTSYVSRITGTGDYAMALEEGYVEKLKADLVREDDQASSKTTDNYKLGDLVKVVEGPFKDMQGKVSGIDPKDTKIEVLLTMFDRDTVVSLDVLQIQKAL